MSIRLFLPMLGSLYAALSLLAAPLSAQEWQHYEMRPVDGYVISFDAPLKKAPEFGGINRSEKTIGGRKVGYNEASALFFLPGDRTYNLRLRVFAEDITLDSWVDYMHGIEKIMTQLENKTPLRVKEFDAGFDDTMNQRTYYRYYSPMFVLGDDGFERKKFRKPTNVSFISLFDGRVMVDIGKHFGEEPIEDDLVRIIERTAGTVDVRYQELFESAEETYMYSTPDIALLLEGPGKLITGDVELEVPTDWIATDTELQKADFRKGIHTGRIVVDIAPYDADTNSATAPNLKLVVEGLPSRGLSRKSYRKRGEEILRTVMGNVQREATRDVSDAMTESMLMPHCASEPHEKVPVNSGGVKAAVYRGKTPAGEDIKALLYTAGGLNLSCNYLFTADPATFDSMLATVEDTLATVKVKALGPWHAAD